MKKILLIIFVLAIIVGGGAFYGGMKYIQNKTPQNFRNQINQMATAGAGLRGNRTGANFASGEIISKDEESITIKLQDGGSKIVFFSDSTIITKSVEGSLNDLGIGKTISINGTANQDGSITANSIQLR